MDLLSTNQITVFTVVNSNYDTYVFCVEQCSWKHTHTDLYKVYIQQYIHVTVMKDDTDILSKCGRYRIIITMRCNTMIMYSSVQC